MYKPSPKTFGQGCTLHSDSQPQATTVGNFIAGFMGPGNHKSNHKSTAGYQSNCTFMVANKSISYLTVTADLVFWISLLTAGWLTYAFTKALVFHSH